MILTTLFVAAMLSTSEAAGQTVPARNDIPSNDVGVRFGFRAGSEAEMKVLPGLVANIGTEVRMKGAFLYDRQWRISGGAEYKIAKRFWLTGDYTYIWKHRDGDKVSPRHRVGLGLKEGWKLSKKVKLTFSEKLQWTHRSGDMNEYQNPRNRLDARFKAKFNIATSRKAALFAFGEVRIAMSSLRLADVYYDSSLMQFTDAGGSPIGDSGWFLRGFGGIRADRWRGGIGINFKFNRHHSIQFSALSDYEYGLKIDADKKGTIIKSLVYDKDVTICGIVTYKFSL